QPGQRARPVAAILRGALRARRLADRDARARAARPPLAARCPGRPGGGAGGARPLRRRSDGRARRGHALGRRTPARRARLAARAAPPAVPARRAAHAPRPASPGGDDAPVRRARRHRSGGRRRGGPRRLARGPACHACAPDRQPRRGVGGPGRGGARAPGGLRCARFPASPRPGRRRAHLRAGRGCRMMPRPHRWVVAALVAAVLVTGLPVGARAGTPAGARARRVVSLAPHLTELLFEAGAGDKVVGASDWSDYPEAARAIPRVGDSHAFDIERILVLRPDLAVAWEGGNAPRHVAALE